MVVSTMLNHRVNPAVMLGFFVELYFPFCLKNIAFGKFSLATDCADYRRFLRKSDLYFISELSLWLCQKNLSHQWQKISEAQKSSLAINLNHRVNLI